MSDRAKTTIALATICVTAVAVRFPLFQSVFLNFDDGILIFNNPVIRNLNWSNVLELLTTNFRNDAQNPMHLANMINWAVGGGTRISFVVVNFGLVVLLVPAAYRFSGLFLRSSGWQLVATAVFALHNVNTDTIAWMSARCHLMATLGFLLSFICWNNYLEAIKPYRKQLWYALSLLFVAATVVTKLMYIGLVPALFIFDLYRRRRLNMSFFLDKVPTFAFLFLYLKLPSISGGGPPWENLPVGMELPRALMNLASFSVEYLISVALPRLTTVAVATTPTETLLQTVPNASVVAMRVPALFNIGVLILLLLSLIWAARRHNMRAPLYLAAMGALVIAPSMIFRPYWPGISFCYRYAFTPSALFAVAGVAIISNRWYSRKKVLKILTGLMLAGIIVVHGTMSFIQSGYWKGERLHWESCIKNYPDAAICYVKLGEHHLGQRRLNAAIHVFKLLDKLITSRDMNHNIVVAKPIGDWLHEKGRNKAAVFYYERSLARERLRPPARKAVEQKIKELTRPRKSKKAVDQKRPANSPNTETSPKP